MEAPAEGQADPDPEVGGLGLGTACYEREDGHQGQRAQEGPQSQWGKTRPSNKSAALTDIDQHVQGHMQNFSKKGL